MENDACACPCIVSVCRTQKEKEKRSMLYVYVVCIPEKMTICIHVVVKKRFQCNAVVYVFLMMEKKSSQFETPIICLL
jgi:hypothetical protein